MLHRLEVTATETPATCAAITCPVEDWLSFLGHRWNAAILWQLSVAPLRFGELSARLDGITPKVLTERLQGLENRGLVTRSPRQTFPRSVSYQLTREGQEVTGIIGLLEPWAERHRPSGSGQSSPASPPARA